MEEQSSIIQTEIAIKVDVVFKAVYHDLFSLFLLRVW